MGRTKGEGWERAVAKWLAADERPLRIELRTRSSVDEPAVGLDSWSPDPHPVACDRSEISARVAEFIASAQSDANESDNRGPFAYCLYALDEDGDILERSPAMKFFNDEMDDLALGETEPATLKGITSQLMRHLEATTKLALHTSVQQNAQLTDIVRSYQQRELEMEQKRYAAFEKYETAVSLEHERALARQQAVEQSRRFDGIVKQITPHIPAVIGRLLARTAVPGAVGETDAAVATTLKSFFESIPPEKLMAVADVLGQDHMASLAEIMMAVDTLSRKAQAAE